MMRLTIKKVVSGSNEVVIEMMMDKGRLPSNGIQYAYGKLANDIAAAPNMPATNTITIRAPLGT